MSARLSFEARKSAAQLRRRAHLRMTAVVVPALSPRHCERSEAIQLCETKKKKAGLLRRKCSSQ
jgi:hypothetical protein